MKFVKFFREVFLKHGYCGLILMSKKLKVENVIYVGIFSWLEVE